MTVTRRSLREQASSASAVSVSPPASPAPRRRRAAGRMIADALLWLAAAGGVVCVVLVILAYTANITLIMFRTGSMSPSIPAGAVAVVQRVPAADLEVGDVVTVDRDGQLPVTHRITSIAPGSTEAERIITMRGDANQADDPFPYTVETARIVLFSIPGIATVIVSFGNPYVLGGITVAAAVLVGWAFWPRAPHPKLDRVKVSP